MGTKERLKEFIKYKRLSDREFCASIGVSFSYINSIRKSIQPDKIKKISEVYPELNTLWLIMGDGNMLLSGDDVSKQIGIGGTSLYANDIASIIKNFQEVIKERDEQIKSLISIIKTLSETKVMQQHQDVRK
ncbi:MAG: helix-turn-helix domain-containing protein [Prevotellaceae bacterium]|jgi:transcriptional regulator with XRE-family HTH domain|nr:helix-turn-helix domain-containing protein [Prevotellaceae bacterium]